MQSRTLSIIPIDFPLCKITVEKVEGYEVKSYLSKHLSLKDALLACEFEMETDKTSIGFHVLFEDNGLLALYYVVDDLCMITNLTGGYQ